MNACWSQILIQLHKNLPEPQCRVWLDPLKGKLRSLKGESVSSGAGGASGPVWSLELAAANDFVAACRAKGLPVETGVFRAHMLVELVNNGPVTILLDSTRLL